MDYYYADIFPTIVNNEHALFTQQKYTNHGHYLVSWVQREVWRPPPLTPSTSVYILRFHLQPNIVHMDYTTLYKKTKLSDPTEQLTGLYSLFTVDALSSSSMKFNLCIKNMVDVINGHFGGNILHHIKVIAHLWLVYCALEVSEGGSASRALEELPVLSRWHSAQILSVAFRTPYEPFVDAHITYSTEK